MCFLMVAVYLLHGSRSMLLGFVRSDVRDRVFHSFSDGVECVIDMLGNLSAVFDEMICCKSSYCADE